MLVDMNQSEKDVFFMKEALLQAEKSFRLAEVPIGAVAVYDNEIVGKGHNFRELLTDPTAHAEILAIKQASSSLSRWRLTGVTLYVTIEPCPMCAGAIVNSRIDRLVYGARDPKGGAVDSLFDIVRDGRLNHFVDVTSGVLAEECSGIMKEFFSFLREKI